MLTVIARETGEPTVLQYLYKSGEDGTFALIQDLGCQRIGEIFEETDEDETYIGNAKDIEFWAQIIEDMNWIDDATERLKSDLYDALGQDSEHNLFEIMDRVGENVDAREPEYMRCAVWAAIQQIREEYNLRIDADE